MTSGPQGPAGPTAGTTAFRLLASDASTNATLIASAPCRVFGIQGESVAAGRLYLKLYDTSVVPAVGTDTPIKTIPLPAGGVFTYDLFGFSFSQGLALALTGSFSDNDTTPVAAGDIMTLNIDWSP